MDLEVLALANLLEALVSHGFGGVMDRFSLRIEDPGLECDIDFGEHRREPFCTVASGRDPCWANVLCQ